MTQKLPIGYQSFRELRGEGCYYVDKTELIDQIIKKDGKVFLFTRPRRFGKTINMDMLNAYFNQKYVGNTWFDGLAVSKLRPDDEEKNAYPVISISFKNLGESYAEFMDSIRFKISELYFEHLEQLNDEPDGFQRKVFMSLYEMKPSNANLKRSLNFLCDMLYRRFGKQVIVLIDEYDSPMNDARDKKTQKKILSFMKGMLSEVLKNDSISMKIGIVTGIMQIAKESIFSGLNNLVINNIFSEQSDEMFGFTQSEVMKLCEDYGHPEKFEEAREWYDGYRFGNEDIYNPWSISYYIGEKFSAKKYWAGTSGNAIIKDLISLTDEDVYDSLKALAKGESICRELKPRVSYDDLTNSPEWVFSVMAMSGYLRTESGSDDFYTISIPNKEVYLEYTKMISEHLTTVGTKIRALYKVLTSGNADLLGKAIESLLMDNMSFKILDDEHSYQVYLAGLLFNFHETYQVQTEPQRGKGYCDILMIPLKPTMPAILFELKKRRKNDPSLDKLSEIALEQIKDKHYAHGLKGKVLLYGAAFESMNVAITSEELDI